MSPAALVEPPVSECVLSSKYVLIFVSKQDISQFEAEKSRYTFAYHHNVVLLGSDPEE